MARMTDNVVMSNLLAQQWYERLFTALTGIEVPPQEPMDPQIARLAAIRCNPLLEGEYLSQDAISSYERRSPDSLSLRLSMARIALYTKPESID